MTLHLAYKQLLANLYAVYDGREAANIADLVIEHVCGLPKIERVMNREFVLNYTQQQSLALITEQLLQNRPVQYVLNQAWFANMKLYVDENVLIPRPETEELVNLIVKEVRDTQAHRADKLRILDVGTGSGCIAIALKKRLPAYEITAIDVSTGALEVARKNAASHQVSIKFLHLNFLNQNEWHQLPIFDVIVSNPPYVKHSEAAAMAPNVLLFEPPLALFVPNDDALIFYKAIADFAINQLASMGKIYVEINEALGDAVVNMFSEKGFTATALLQDMQGKHRMVKAER